MEGVCGRPAQAIGDVMEGVCGRPAQAIGDVMEGSLRETSSGHRRCNGEESAGPGDQLRSSASQFITTFTDILRTPHGRREFATSPGGLCRRPSGCTQRWCAHRGRISSILQAMSLRAAAARCGSCRGRSPPAADILITCRAARWEIRRHSYSCSDTVYRPALSATTL